MAVVVVVSAEGGDGPCTLRSLAASRSPALGPRPLLWTIILAIIGLTLCAFH